MFVNSVVPHVDCDLVELQPELLKKPEDIFFETEKYHAKGFIRHRLLALSPCEGNDPALLQPLSKRYLDISPLGSPFDGSSFHVYFLDTDYPIFYKQAKSTLHFALPGSGFNFLNDEYFHNSNVFSRVEVNYFDYLLSHDKPLNEIFRNFKFNGVTCDSVKTIKMSGGSLGASMQQLLLIYVLQNSHMFSDLKRITLDMISPVCFHPKIIASLNRQFHDSLLHADNLLVIAMNYVIHLKDAIPRRGNPVALRHTNKRNSHKVNYKISLYAYCKEKECCHQMRDNVSNRDACDIVPNGKKFRKYHATQRKMKKYKPYLELKTSKFQEVQNLVDKFFLNSSYLLSDFEGFILNAYGENCLKDSNIHLFLYSHEKLASAILSKYKQQCVLSGNYDEKMMHLDKVIRELEDSRGICALKHIIQEGPCDSLRHVKLNSKYLELCNAKSEFVKLMLQDDSHITGDEGIVENAVALKPLFVEQKRKLHDNEESYFSFDENVMQTLSEFFSELRPSLMSSELFSLNEADLCETPKSDTADTDMEVSERIKDANSILSQDISASCFSQTARKRKISLAHNSSTLKVLGNPEWLSPSKKPRYEIADLYKEFEQNTESQQDVGSVTKSAYITTPTAKKIARLNCKKN